MALKLEIIATPGANYSARTRHNCRAADLTAAFALDFNTPGEVLTAKHANIYVHIPLTMPIPAAVDRLYAELCNVKTLNIAGNGLHTLSRFGWTQQNVNRYIFTVLSRAISRGCRIDTVLSGGQTGADIAGIIAAHTLGIDAIATFPDRYLQRLGSGQDVTHTRAEMMDQILDGACRLITDCRAESITQ